MPKFQIDSPQGSFEVDAPDEQTALKAFQQMQNAAAPGPTSHDLVSADRSLDGLSLEQITGQAADHSGDPMVPPAAPGEWRGTLLPVGKDANGNLGFAMPQMLADLLNTGKNAVTAPERALNGQLPPYAAGPDGRVTPNPEMNKAAFDAASLMTTVGGTGLASRNMVRGAAPAGAETFGIPLTKGQKTGDLPQLTKEESLRQMNVGSDPSTIMRNFDAKQRTAINEAADRVGMSLGGPSPNMAEQVMNGVRAKAFMHEDAANSLYSIARDAGASVKTEALDALPASVRQSLETANIIIDPELTPAATVALREIEKAAQRGGALNPAQPKTGPLPKETVAVSIDGLEQVRKRIVSLQANKMNDNDARALRAVKDAFDQWYDDSIDNMLFSGDPAALDALKGARKEWALYKAISKGEPGDTASMNVEKMLREDTTAEEVANWLYGASVAHPSLQSAKTAALVKETLGEGSPEWAAVRGAAWERLIRNHRSEDGSVHSATKLSNAIMDFLNNGKTLSGILFTQEERNEMFRLAAVLRKTVTPKDATNPSRSAWTIMSAIGDKLAMGAAGAAGASAELMGIGLGVPGAMTGAAMFGTRVWRKAAAKRAARKSTGEPTSWLADGGRASARAAPFAIGAGASNGRGWLNLPPMFTAPGLLPPKGQ